MIITFALLQFANLIRDYLAYERFDYLGNFAADDLEQRLHPFFTVNGSFELP